MEFTRPFVRKFVQRVDGEDYPVVVVLTHAVPAPPDEPDTAVCEGCGQEVSEYVTTDTEEVSSEELVVSECLPCFFRGDFESLRPA
jgi:hypothetical protein